MALVMNMVHLVGRYYRIHEPVGTKEDRFSKLEGTMVGLEINLDIL